MDICQSTQIEYVSAFQARQRFQSYLRNTSQLGKEPVKL